MGWRAAYSGYKYAVANQLNPWTGESLVPPPTAPTAPATTDTVKTSTAPSRGGVDPVNKGKAGIERCINEIEAAGGTVLGTEIPIEIDGITCQIDVAADFDGTIYLYEIKNGTYAFKFTTNQSFNYPQMLGDNIPITYTGPKAQLFQQPISNTNYVFGIIWYRGDVKITITGYPK